MKSTDCRDSESKKYHILKKKKKMMINYMAAKRDCVKHFERRLLLYITFRMTYNMRRSKQDINSSIRKYLQALYNNRILGTLRPLVRPDCSLALQMQKV